MNRIDHYTNDGTVILSNSYWCDTHLEAELAENPLTHLEVLHRDVLSTRKCVMCLEIEY